MHTQNSMWDFTRGEQTTSHVDSVASYPQEGDRGREEHVRDAVTCSFTHSWSGYAITIHSKWAVTILFIKLLFRVSSFVVNNNELNKP